MDIQAAMGIHQLKRVDKYWKRWPGKAEKVEHVRLIAMQVDCEVKTLFRDKTLDIAGEKISGYWREMNL